MSEHLKGSLLIIQGWILGLAGVTLQQASATAELWNPILKGLSFIACILSTIYGAYKLSKKKE